LAQPGSNAESPAAAEADATRAARFEFLGHIETLLEPLLAALGLIFLLLILVDLSDFLTTPDEQIWLDRAINGIWAIFIIDFVVRFIVAPDKRHYLRHNWLMLVLLLLPFLRPLRALGAVGVVRSLSLIYLLTGLNRGMRVVESVARGRQLAYVAALSVLVMLTGAIGVLYFERGMPDSPIRTLGDALWWSAALLTTINNEKYVVSVEARTIAVLQGLFAISIFGFVTASIASHFIDRLAEQRAADEASDDAQVASMHGELGALRRENEALREEMRVMRRAIEQLAASAKGAAAPTPDTPPAPHDRAP
jgi:voltage-gated potassium channel